MKLLETIRIEGKIKIITGLHIGGSNEKMEIGGMDNPIIKNPSTNLPYIPGSSLKGKMRSLLEWNITDKLDLKGDVHSCPDKNCPICRIFGSSERIKDRGSTRLIVRDSYINEVSMREFEDKDIQLTEDKSENTINRITAHANPRPIERVVPGVIFDFKMVYKIIDTEDNGEHDRKNLNKIFKAFKLIENDTLGGGGSRGNGKVEFKEVVKFKNNEKEGESINLEKYL